MTNKELQDRLKMFPDNIEVMLTDDYNFEIFAHSIKKVYLCKPILSEGKVIITSHVDRREYENDKLQKNFIDW